MIGRFTSALSFFVPCRQEQNPPKGRVSGQNITSVTQTGPPTRGSKQPSISQKRSGAYFSLRSVLGLGLLLAACGSRRNLFTKLSVLVTQNERLPTGHEKRGTKNARGRAGGRAGDDDEVTARECSMMESVHRSSVCVICSNSAMREKKPK